MPRWPKMKIVVFSVLFAVMLTIVLSVITVQGDELTTDIRQFATVEPGSITLTDDDNDGVPNATDQCISLPGPADNGGCPTGSGAGANNAGGGGSNNSDANSGESGTSNADADRDGVTDEIDRCPFVSGRGDQYGGVNGADGCPVDSDSDGTVDGLDVCPFSPQPPGPSGCDNDTSAPVAPSVTSVPQIPLANLPDLSDACLVATRGPDRVNIRALPDINAPRIGALDPTRSYVVLERFRGPDDEWLRTTDGWVARWVTRTNASCASFLEGSPLAVEIAPAGLNLSAVFGLECDLSAGVVATLPIVTHISAMAQSDPCVVLEGPRDQLLFNMDNVLANQQTPYSDQNNVRARMWNTCPLGNLAWNTLEVLESDNPTVYLEIMLDLQSISTDFVFCQYVDMLRGADYDPNLVIFQPPLVDIYPAVCRMSPLSVTEPFGEYQKQRDRIAAITLEDGYNYDRTGLFMDSNTKSITCILMRLSNYIGDMNPLQRDFYWHIRMECDNVGPVLALAQVKNTIENGWDVQALLDAPIEALCATLADAPRNKAEQSIPVFMADFSVLDVPQVTPPSSELDFGQCADDMWVMFQQHHTTLYMLQLANIVNASPQIQCLLVQHVLDTGHLNRVYYGILHDTLELEFPSRPACLDVLDLGQFDPFIFVLPDEIITSAATAEEKWAVIARSDQCAPLDPSAVPEQVPTTIGDLPEDVPLGTDISMSDIQAVNMAVAELNNTRPDLIPGTDEHTSAVLELVSADSPIGQQLTAQREFLLSNSESELSNENLTDELTSVEPVDVSEYDTIEPLSIDINGKTLTTPDRLPVEQSVLPTDIVQDAFFITPELMAPVHYRDLLTVVVFVKATLPDMPLDSPEFAQSVSDALPTGHPLVEDIETLQLILPQIGFNTIELTPLDVAELLETMETTIASYDDTWLLDDAFVDMLRMALPTGHPLTSRASMVQEMLLVFAKMVPKTQGGLMPDDHELSLSLGELAALLRAVNAVQIAENVPFPGSAEYTAAIQANLPTGHPLINNEIQTKIILGG